MSGLSKKDSTTKFKALQGLQALVSSANTKPTSDATTSVSTATAQDASSASAATGASTALELIQHWPRLYRRLSIDPDRRVRLQAQVLLGQLGVAVGKKIVPHLSSLMGPWLSAQHDPSTDVASAAVAAFEAVFPVPEKRAKVRPELLKELTHQ